MAHYQVTWSKPGQSPRASSWYVYIGVITYASGVLKQWEGGSHVALVHYLLRRGYVIEYLDAHCVPPTIKYHKQLKQTVEALLSLLKE
jgi:hypothetical protein